MTESRMPKRIRSVAWLLGLGLSAFLLCLLGCRTLMEGWFGPPAVTQEESYQQGEGKSFDHSGFDALLKDIVDAQGLVRYEKASPRQSELVSYLGQLAKAEFDPFSRDEKLAFLINAYNAATLLLILENLPLESIQDIPAARRWDARRWNLLGQKLSLTQIEHEYLRKRFADPRIHFAVNCASLGCPPLRNEAYVGSRIEAQLEDQARRMHRDPYWFTYAADQLHVTRLYLWYRGDFLQKKPSIQAFAAQWSPALRKALAQGREPGIQYRTYDWALNQSGARK